MEVFRSEIKAGILIMVAAIALAIGIFLIADIQWEDRNHFTLLFPYAAGINKGSPVWYAGFEVGEVSDIKIVHGKNGKQDSIALTITIDPKATVREDSKAYIRDLGMMGAKYVEISPGSTDKPKLPNGGVLEGRAPSSLTLAIEKIDEKFDEIFPQVKMTIEDIQSLVHEIRSSSPIHQAIQNTNAFMVEMRQRGKELQALFRKIDSLLSTSQTSIEGLAGSFQETSQALRQTTGEIGDETLTLLGELRDTNRRLQEMVASLEGQVTPVIGQAHKDLTEIEGLLRDARSVVEANDPNIYQLLYHLKEASRHIDALSEDLRAHPWKILWKAEGTSDAAKTTGPEEWREKGRIGRHGKE